MKRLHSVARVVALSAYFASAGTAHAGLSSCIEANFQIDIYPYVENEVILLLCCRHATVMMQAEVLNPEPVCTGLPPDESIPYFIGQDGGGCETCDPEVGCSSSHCVTTVSAGHFSQHEYPTTCASYATGTAEVYCCNPQQEVVEIKLKTTNCVELCDCQDESHQYHHISTAWGSARSIYVVKTVSGGNASLAVDIDPGSDFSGPLRRTVAVATLDDGTIDTVAGWLEFGGGGSQPYGISSVGGGVYEFADVPISSGETEISSSVFSFGRGDLDENQDGRFNRLDVASLQGKLTQTATSFPLSNFDFNRSGSIDSDDVAFLQQLIDLGAEDGILGDFDGDGFLTCIDAANVSSSLFNDTVGSVDYNVRLDADLDGITDSTDEAAVAAALASPISADYDNSSFVDTDDLDAFIIDFENGDPPADIDGSGFVDIDDYTLFILCFQEGC